MKRNEPHKWRFRDSWRTGTPEMSVREVHDDYTAIVELHDGTTKRMTCDELEKLCNQLGDACYWMGFLSKS